MSEQLKDALRTIKEAAESGAPVVFLHDPDTYQPFGMLIVDQAQQDVAEKSLMNFYDVEMIDHSHLEGDEDDDGVC